MVKTVIKVEGMMCPMCEKHVKEAIEKTFAAQQATATASHTDKKVEITSAAPLDYAAAAAVITEAGYTPLGEE